MARPEFPSDIGREQFSLVRDMLEAARRKTRPRKHDLYDVYCAVLYFLHTGSAWRSLPRDFLPGVPCTNISRSGPCCATATAPCSNRPSTSWGATWNLRSCSACCGRANAFVRRFRKKFIRSAQAG